MFSLYSEDLKTCSLAVPGMNLYVACFKNSMPVVKVCLGQISMLGRRSDCLPEF